MDFSSLHVCMESSDHWLQGTMNEESSGKDSSSLSSPCGGDMLACSRPTMAAERRLRPPHDQALKCPRCDSTHTKFCYYNNYSLSQPRYFCKTCRRYWTKGGTLRNIPVGGGCRKNKKVSSKKQNEPTLPSSTIATNITHHQNNQPHPIASFHHHNPKDLQLSFPADMQFSHFNNLLGSPNFMESKYSLGMLDNSNHRPIDFMETSTILRNHNHNSRNNNNNFDFFEINSSEMGVGGGMNVLGGDMSGSLAASNYQNLCTFGGNSNMSSLNGNYNNLMESSCQRLMLPYDHHHHASDSSSMDVKPNPKLLALEWQEQGCSDAGKDSFGYLNGSGSWNGVINGYGSSSTTNPLV